MIPFRVTRLSNFNALIDVKRKQWPWPTAIEVIYLSETANAQFFEHNHTQIVLPAILASDFRSAENKSANRAMWPRPVLFPTSQAP